MLFRHIDEAPRTLSPALAIIVDFVFEAVHRGDDSVVKLSYRRGRPDLFDIKVRDVVQKSPLILALGLLLERLEEVARVHVLVEAISVEAGLAELAVEGHAGDCRAADIEVRHGGAQFPQRLQHRVSAEREAGEEHVCAIRVKVFEVLQVQLEIVGESKVVRACSIVRLSGAAPEANAVDLLVTSEDSCQRRVTIGSIVAF